MSASFPGPERDEATPRASDAGVAPRGYQAATPARQGPPGGLPRPSTTDHVADVALQTPGQDGPGQRTLESVSIVLVTKDDPRVIDCLDSVLEQEAPIPFTVTVVGEWSAPEIPSRLRERYGDDDRVAIETTTAPFMVAWNQAARGSAGDIIVRVDSDTIAQPGWLASLVAPILEGQVPWTAGYVHGPETFSSLTQRYFHHRTVAYLDRKKGRRLTCGAVPSWNVAYRRDALDDVGWFDETFVASEDWDLHRRLADAGYEGLLVEDALVRHDHPDRLRDLFAKERWYKAGQVQMARKHGLASTWGVFQIPIAYAGLATLAVAGLVQPWLAWAALAGALLLALKQMTSAAREGDPTWVARPLFRVFEGLGGMLGTATGLMRAGVSWVTGRFRKGTPELS